MIHFFLPSFHSHSTAHRSHWGEENGLQLRRPGGQETKLKCTVLHPPPQTSLPFSLLVRLCLYGRSAASHPYLSLLSPVEVDELGRRCSCKNTIETRVRENEWHYRMRQRNRGSTERTGWGGRGGDWFRLQLDTEWEMQHSIFLHPPARHVLLRFALTTLTHTHTFILSHFICNSYSSWLF